MAFIPSKKYDKNVGMGIIPLIAAGVSTAAKIKAVAAFVKGVGGAIKGIFGKKKISAAQLANNYHLGYTDNYNGLPAAAYNRAGAKPVRRAEWARGWNAAQSDKIAVENAVKNAVAANQSLEEITRAGADAFTGVPPALGGKLGSAPDIAAAYLQNILMKYSEPIAQKLAARENEAIARERAKADAERTAAELSAKLQADAASRVRAEAEAKAIADAAAEKARQDALLASQAQAAVIAAQQTAQANPTASNQAALNAAIVAANEAVAAANAAAQKATAATQASQSAQTSSSTMITGAGITSVVAPPADNAPLTASMFDPAMLKKVAMVGIPLIILGLMFGRSSPAPVVVRSNPHRRR